MVACEFPDDGEFNGDPVVREQFVDCVIKLDVSKDSGLAVGSLLLPLLLLLSEIVIDIRRPPESVFASYVIVVVAYSSNDDTPSGETL